MKRFIPIFTVFATAVVVLPVVEEDFQSDPSVAFIVLAAVICCLIWVFRRSGLFTFADIVQKEGNTLRISRDSTEETIPLEQIKALEAEFTFGQPIICVRLSSETKFGTRVRFFPNEKPSHGEMEHGAVMRLLEIESSKAGSKNAT